MGYYFLFSCLGSFMPLDFVLTIWFRRIVLCCVADCCVLHLLLWVGFYFFGCCVGVFLVFNLGWCVVLLGVLCRFFSWGWVCLVLSIFLVLIFTVFCDLVVYRSFVALNFVFGYLGFSLLFLILGL